MSGTDLAERMGVKPDTAAPRDPDGDFFTTKDRKWLNEMGIAADTPEEGEEVTEGPQQNFDARKAKEEYEQVHLRKRKGFFGRIFNNWFRPNKLKDTPIEKDYLKGKIENEFRNALKEGHNDPEEVRLRLERRGIQLSKEEIEQLAAELFAHQKRNEALKQSPPSAGGVQRHPQTRPMR